MGKSVVVSTDIVAFDASVTADSFLALTFESELTASIRTWCRNGHSGGLFRDPESELSPSMSSNLHLAPAF